MSNLNKLPLFYSLFVPKARVLSHSGIDRNRLALARLTASPDYFTDGSSTHTDTTPNQKSIDALQKTTQYQSG